MSKMLLDLFYYYMIDFSFFNLSWPRGGFSVPYNQGSPD